MLLYDNKFENFLGKSKMHWLGPYVIKDILNGVPVQLMKMNGEVFPSRINGSRLKVYKDDIAPVQ